MNRLPAGVWIAGGLVVVALLAVAGRYGFHRDEFYFVVTGQHPGVGAVDNPMLVPYLAAGWYALVDGHLWAFRILPALAMAGYVVIGGLIAVELSPARRHQVAGAVATALTGLVLPVGHLFETTTFDALITAAALWQLIRAMDTDRWRPWLAFGVLFGVAMEVKLLAAVVVFCCLIGVLLVGPRRRLATPRPWVAGLVALALAAPNLGWQLAHGFPMAAVAGGIAAGDSTSSTPRAALIPTTLLEIGPLLCIVSIVGIVRLLRRPYRRDRLGWLPVGFLVFVLLMLVAGGKAYYTAGFYPALMAAGAIPVLDWVSRHRPRRVQAIVAVVISVIVTAGLTLPLFPPGSPLYAAGVATNPDMAETVGWPIYVRTVTAVADRLPAGQRRATVILTANYGEAGALTLARQSGELYTDLPPVYSGHNMFWYWGPPPASATAAVVVGEFSTDQLARWYTHCTIAERLNSPPGVDNQETGAPVRVCSDRRIPWRDLWPQLRHS